MLQEHSCFALVLRRNFDSSAFSRVKRLESQLTNAQMELEKLETQQMVRYWVLQSGMGYYYSRAWGIITVGHYYYSRAWGIITVGHGVLPHAQMELEKVWKQSANGTLLGITFGHGVLLHSGMGYYYSRASGIITVGHGVLLQSGMGYYYSFNGLRKQGREYVCLQDVLVLPARKV